MEVRYSFKALEDIEFWKKSGNKTIMLKIQSLIQAIELSPYSGIGKPEPLKYELSGFWSRRINDQHRIIYNIDNNVIRIHSLKGHY